MIWSTAAMCMSARLSCTVTLLVGIAGLFRDDKTEAYRAFAGLGFKACILHWPGVTLPLCRSLETFGHHSDLACLGASEPSTE